MKFVRKYWLLILMAMPLVVALVGLRRSAERAQGAANCTGSVTGVTLDGYNEDTQMDGCQSGDTNGNTENAAPAHHEGDF